VVQRYFAVGTVALGLGTAGFVRIRLADPANSTYHNLVLLVGLIATAAYAAMTAGLGYVTVAGTTVYLPRYVQWILATPLIVVYLGLLAGISRRRIAALAVLDVAAMGAALAAALTTTPVRYGAFVVGAALYVALLYYLRAGLEQAARKRFPAEAADREGGGQQRPPAVAALFRKLRNLTVVSWTFYPVVWLLGPLGVGLLAPAAEILLTTYLDLIAKVAFGFIAVNSRAALAELPDVDALRAWRATVA
jgi:sensory rhodopsin